MINWNNERPVLKENVSALGIGKAIYAAPDGSKENARLLIAADGFHFKNSDFDDLVLPRIVFDTPDGSKYDLSFNDEGELLINGNKLITSTNQNDEMIAGNKTYTGLTNLEGGLRLNSPNGTVFNVKVDDDGELNAKEVTNA